MRKKYITILLLFNLGFILLYLIGIPGWLKQSDFEELRTYYPQFYVPVFLYVKYGLYFHLILFLFWYKTIVHQLSSILLPRQYVFLLIFPILTFLNVKFYPNLNFPNLDFLLYLKADDNKGTFPHEEVRKAMQPLEVHQSIYLIYYLHDNKTAERAHSYLEERKNLSKCCE